MEQDRSKLDIDDNVHRKRIFQMKIYITGHTSGLGKTIYDYFVKSKYETIGFSKSNGYDLEKDFDKIINEIDNDCVFINNSYANGIQKRYLETLHNKVNKMIVFGSIASHYPDVNRLKYSEDKKILVQEFYKYATTKSKTEYLLLDLTSSSYKDSDLIIESIMFWISNPKIIRMGFNIDD
jgi:nucleoside-diphosphate-sugar epimerase